MPSLTINTNVVDTHVRKRVLALGFVVVLIHDLRCASQDLGDADSKKTLMTKLTQVRSWHCRDDRFERRRKHERTH